MVASLPTSKGPHLGHDQIPGGLMPKGLVSDDARKAPTLPFRPRLQRPRLHREASATREPSPLSIPAVHQAQAWFYGYFDQSGILQIAWSPSIKPSLKEAFRPAFLEKLKRVVAEENVSLCAGLTGDETVKSINEGLPTESPAFSTLGVRTQTFIRNNKRALSKESIPTKRRKSCPQDAEESFCVDSDYETATIKTEEESVNFADGDESEDEDKNEFVDAGFISMAVRVDDEEQLERIVDTRLRQMQQIACKTIAKPWIKAKEPQKQTKYPYNGGQRKEEARELYGKENLGEINKPPWWPSTEGWPYRGCRHKEPDHLKKPERLVLMKHMLKICPVAMLKESTKEVGSGPNGLKPPAMNHLREIYRIRERQERFERGEIDGGTRISVEQLPTMSINGEKTENGGTELSTVTKTRESSLEAIPRSGVPFGSQASKQETATGEEFLLIDQDYNDMGQPNGEDMQVPCLKTEKGHEPSQPIRTSYDVYNKYKPLVGETIKRKPQSQPPDLLFVEPKQTTQPGLAASIGLKATTRSFDSYLPDYDIGCIDGSDLPDHDGLPHDPAWFSGYGGNLSHLPHTESSGSSNQAMSFFNDNYCFGNTPPMNNAYRGSIYNEFSDPAVGGGRGQLSDFPHHFRR